MKVSAILLGIACVSTALSVKAQPTITADDMFNQVGEYYRAYANDTGTTVSVAGLIGETGGPHLWDFTDGPEDQIFRFDYLDPQSTIYGFDFPESNIAERKTEEDSGDQSWLLFRQVPDIGRRVYGFWDSNFNPANPSHIFEPPIVDFPSQIRYNANNIQIWSNSMTYDTDYVLSDDFIIPTRITQTSKFEVDAWGVMELPKLGFEDVLRVNELVEISTAFDINLEGQYTNVDTQYARNYYFLQPGRGIAAQINGKPTANPSSTINTASFFIRMFETNKTTSGTGCNGAMPVEDLSISISNGRALIKWTKTDCTMSYRVEYTEGNINGGDWQVLGEPTEQNFMLDSNVSAQRLRYYRVVSLP